MTVLIAETIFFTRSAVLSWHSQLRRALTVWASVQPEVTRFFQRAPANRPATSQWTDHQPVFLLLGYCCIAIVRSAQLISPTSGLYIPVLYSLLAFYLSRRCCVISLFRSLCVCVCVTKAMTSRPTWRCFSLRGSVSLLYRKALAGRATSQSILCSRHGRSV